MLNCRPINLVKFYKIKITQMKTTKISDWYAKPHIKKLPYLYPSIRCCNNVLDQTEIVKIWEKVYQNNYIYQLTLHFREAAGARCLSS